MAMSVPEAVSRFVPIAACPVCGRSQGTTTFYEQRFDAPPVSEFMASYYGGRIPASVLEGEVFRIQHCPGCDFYWHANVLEPSTMAELYDHWLDSRLSRAKQDARGVKERMHLCTLAVRWLEAAGADSLHPKVLDVGGGWGTFALCARALGCETYLLESSPVRRRHVESLGLQTVSSLSALDAASFDLAVMNQSLEHIPHPVQLLEQVRRVLKPGGGLAVDVPRADPACPVLARGPFQPLEHINGFTERSLRGAVIRAGLLPASDYSRYTALSVRAVAGAAVRNFKLWLTPSPTSASEEVVSCFASRPRSQ
jgi:SAM-dependent methyltransferase